MASRAAVAGRVLSVLGLVIALAAGAETPAEKKAREDLERELGQMVEKPPTRVKVLFLGLEDPNYRVEDPEIELDGTRLKLPSTAVLSDEGEHPIFAGDVQPGHHVVHVGLTIVNGTSVVFSDEGGFKWRLTGEVGFDVYSGIEVQVRITPQRVDGQKDVAKRFRIHLPAKPIMLARLDDGKMPEPMAKKPPPPPPPPPPVEVVDAGQPVVVAAVEPPKVEPAKAEPKRPEPPVRRSLPLREPHVTLQPQPEKLPPGPVLPDDPIDAGAPKIAEAPVAVDDAGVPPIATAPVALPPPAAELPPDDSKLYGWLLFGGGAVLVIVGLFVLTRRKEPRVED